MIANKAKIIIKDNVLAGCNLTIVSSDFRGFEPDKRLTNEYEGKDVVIGNNVFIGNNVTILKFVSIGDNCVIGNGSLVTKNIPPDCFAAGNPAKVIRKL